MQKNSKQSEVRRILCVSLLIILISIFYSIRVNATNVSYDPPSYSSLTPHDPISIISDSDFEVFPGSGTEEDPYVIEGYNITTTSTKGIITASTKGIYITDTTKYFIIRNCLVDADYGIYISNVANGTATVINNTCSNNNYGIYFYGSSGSTVSNNTCKNNGKIGIWLHNSPSSTVANNMCNNNGYDGIWLYYSGRSTVTNNTCNNNSCGISLRFSNSSTVAINMCNNNYYDGIMLEDSGSSTVANNMCSDNDDDGIALWYSGSSTVENNTFTNCGLEIREGTIDAYLLYSIENNWVNGKKLGFYTNLDSTMIDETVYGQLILVNCTSVTVRNQILNNTSTGLFLYSCTYSVVINNTCNNNGEGIVLEYSGSSTIVNNTCNNNWNGISLYSSVSSTVANNTCTNNNMGISLHHSGSSTATINTCNNNWKGISLSSSGSSTVANNTCNNNINCGISLWFSGSSTIVNNMCSNNNYGISLGASGFCVVTYNLLQENKRYGVYLYESYGGYLYFYSNNNLIHHNTFVDNNLGGTSQAFDECTDNYWYDSATQEGNYWSDWSGTGNYSIDGSASSIDLYPLDEPAEYSTDETQMFFTPTLLIVVVPLIFTKLFSRKRLKID